MRIERPASSSGSVDTSDNTEFYFGSDNDFWFIYDETTDDALELWTSDSDGAGLDAELVSIPSGGTTVTINNDLVVGNDLNVQNDLDVDNDLNVDGNAVIDGTLNIAANALLSGGGADGKLILSNLAADQGVLFDTTTNGQLTLTDEAAAALDVRIDGLIFDGVGPLTLGTDGSTSHSLTTGDVFCGNDLEVDGDLYIDGQTIASTSGGISVGGNSFIGNGYMNIVNLNIYSPPYTYCSLRTKADDGAHLAIGEDDGAANRNLIITNVANGNKDHDHDTLSTNPTIFLHSVTDPDSDNTQWMSFEHDQTNGVIDVGTGALSLSPTNGTIIMSNLPTADPTNAGQLWNNSGVLTVSAG